MTWPESFGVSSSKPCQKLTQPLPCRIGKRLTFSILHARGWNFVAIARSSMAASNRWSVTKL